MKKYCLILALITLIGVCFAQSSKEEALQSLDSAKSMLSQDNYSKAMDEINYAITKINEIQSDLLVKMLPAAQTGYTEKDRQAGSVGGMGAMFGSANAITATANYAQGQEDSDNYSTVTITVSVGGLVGQMGSLAAMGQMYGGAQPGTKTVRVQGYTGSLQWNADDKSATLTVQVGAKTTVVIEGHSLPNGDVLTAWANSMKLGDLEKSF